VQGVCCTEVSKQPTLQSPLLMCASVTASALRVRFVTTAGTHPSMA
jgi:hypothetical protein